MVMRMRYINNMRRYRPVGLLILVFLVNLVQTKGQYCTSNARYTEIPFFDTSAITVGSNIQYGTATDYLGNAYALRMDVYYPNLTLDSSPKRPFVMLFHGGGFVSGDKQAGDIKDLCIHLARRGYVAATVNYRLGYENTEYGQYKARYRAIQDGHAAMRYLVNNANVLRIDTNWLFVGGQSAGSILALGMVYADPVELDSVSLRYSSSSVSQELGNLYSSGNNLTSSYRFKGVFNNWGAVTESELDADELLPTVAFHGGLDSVVYIDTDSSFLYYRLLGSRRLHQRLLAGAVCSELTVDTAGGHGIFRNSSAEFRAGRASCFFKSIFCNSCTNYYATDSVVRNCSQALSTKAISEEQPLKVYPNPFEQRVNIEGLEGDFAVQLYNSLGQLVYHHPNTHSPLVLDLLPGLYFLTITQAATGKSYHTPVVRE